MPFYVPVEDYPEVCRFWAERCAPKNGSLSELRNSSAEADEADAPAPGPTGKLSADERVWSIEQLTKLSNSRYRIVKRVAAVMDHLAAFPGAPVPTADLIEATGLTKAEMQSAWTKWPKHAALHYGESHRPMHVQWGPDAGLPRAQMYYTLGQEQARRWKQVREGNA